MASQHAEKGLLIRPPAAVRKETQTLLRARHREMSAFLIACMTALVADPDGFLQQLGGHWPPPKPRGRPPASRS